MAITLKKPSKRNPQADGKEPKKALTPEETDLLLQLARASLERYGTILPPKEELYKTANAECPKCGHVGPLPEDFGFRQLRNGDLRPQSWCRKCRNSAISHPTRGR